MKSDKKKVFDCLHKVGILEIYRDLMKIYRSTSDTDLKKYLKAVLDNIAIPLSLTKKTKDELLRKGNLDLTKQPYKILLNYVLN